MPAQYLRSGHDLIRNIVVPRLTFDQLHERHPIHIGWNRYARQIVDGWSNLLEFGNDIPDVVIQGD